MKKFKVYATMTTRLVAEVTANSQYEAIQKAEAIDGADFKEQEPWGGGWEITNAVEITPPPRHLTKGGKKCK